MNNKIFLLTGMLLISVALKSQQTFTITASGFTFVPSTLEVNVGDIIEFNTGASHPVVQVSQATWQANGTTPLPGGFSFPSGSGAFTANSSGTIYYVCANHVQSEGMKGTIIVSQATGIDDVKTRSGKIYPVPANDYLIYQAADGIHIDEIKIMDMTGKPVIILEGQLQSKEGFRIDVSGLNRGFYIFRIKSGENVFFKKFLKS